MRAKCSGFSSRKNAQPSGSCRPCSSEDDRAIELRNAGIRHRKLISKIRLGAAASRRATYGYWRGGPANRISLKRLDARPIATLSIEAQERHEREKSPQKSGIVGRRTPSALHGFHVGEKSLSRRLSELQRPWAAFLLPQRCGGSSFYPIARTRPSFGARTLSCGRASSVSVDSSVSPAIANG